MNSEFLSLSHRRDIEDARKRTPHLVSELNFTNLFVWRTPHQHRVSFHKGHCLVSFQKEGRTCYYQPFGPDPASLMTEMLSADPETVFCRVHRDVGLNVTGAEYSADRNNYDYLYSREELASLKGGKFESIRRHIRRFEAKGPRVVPIGEENITDCRPVQRHWCEQEQGCEEADGLALEEAISHFDALPITGVLVYLDDEPVAFAMGEALTDTMFVEHFEKAKPIQGAYQYVLHQLVKTLSFDIRYVNREQDLGMHNLREAKLRLKPREMIEKYTVTAGGAL